MQRSLEQHSRYLDSLMRDAASLPPASAAAKPEAAAAAAPVVPLKMPAASTSPDDTTAPYLPADSRLAATETHFGDSMAADGGVVPPLDMLPGDAGCMSFSLGDDQHFGDAALATDAGGWPLMGHGLDAAGLPDLQEGVADWF
jgi:hypothetical protein